MGRNQPVMEKSHNAKPGKWIYEIRVEGQLSQEWSAWFDGLTIQSEPNGETGTVNTVICGAFPDQAAVYGALNKLRDLNLVILSCQRKE
jgi:hypothetical protein